MIYSMTGYAARALDFERGALHIELKSVNSRYLDFQFRISEELRAIELPLRDLFSANLTRGKIECRLGFSAHASGNQTLALNGDLLQQLKTLDAQVRDEMPQAAVPDRLITPREVEILGWIRNGKSNEEIGRILDISPLTVKNHVQKILRKLNVQNRAQAVARGIALRLIPSTSA